MTGSAWNGMRRTAIKRRAAIGRRSGIKRRRPKRRTIPPDVRAFVMARDGYACQYCGRRATQIDHVVPWRLRRTRPEFEAVEYLVAADDCNLLKGTRALAPPSWAGRLHELPGVKPWRVWDGDPVKLREMIA